MKKLYALFATLLCGVAFAGQGMGPGPGVMSYAGGGGGELTITKTQDWTAAEADDGTAAFVALTLVSNPANRNLIVCFVNGGNSPAISTPVLTDNFGDSGGTAWAGFTQNPTLVVNTGPEVIYGFYRRVGSGAFDKVVTATTAGELNYKALQCALAGTTSGTPTWTKEGEAEDTGGGGVATTACVSCSISTSNASTWVIGAMGNNNTGFPTANTGFSRIDAAHLGGWYLYDIQDQITTSSGSYTASWSALGSGDYYTAQAVAFEAN